MAHGVTACDSGTASQRAAAAAGDTASQLRTERASSAGLGVCYYPMGPRDGVGRCAAGLREWTGKHREAEGCGQGLPGSGTLHVSLVSGALISWAKGTGLGRGCHCVIRPRGRAWCPNALPHLHH